MSNLLSGLVQGFAQSSQDAQKKADEEELRKLQVKAFKSQLEAKSKLDQLMTGSVNMGSPTDPTNADLTMTPGKSIIDLMSDPEGQRLLLQGGMATADQLVKDPQSIATSKLINSITEGMFPKSLNAPMATGQPGTPGGLALDGINIGSGGPQLSLKRPDVIVRDMETPGGTRSVAFDKNTLQPLGILGTPKDDKVTPEQGGRIAGLVQAQDLAKQVRADIFDEKGGINRVNILNTQGLPGFSGTPGTQGRIVRQRMENAIDAVVRARTGAAMTKDEMEKTLDQFLPSPLDSDAGIVDKMDRFDQFVGGALEVITLPESFRAKLKSKPSSNPGKQNDGPTAVNPKTGERIIFRNGKWQPL